MNSASDLAFGLFLYSAELNDPEKEEFLRSDSVERTDTGGGKCAPFSLPHFDGEVIYEERLAAPNDRLRTMCEEARNKTEQILARNWMVPVEGLWPLLLGFALGVRLARVHADVRAELEDSRSSQTHSQAFCDPTLADLTKAPTPAAATEPKETESTLEANHDEGSWADATNEKTNLRPHQDGREGS